MLLAERMSEKAKGKHLPVVDLPNFIQATRDSGYRNSAAAFAEFVDNSIEAGATRIDIDLRTDADGQITIEVLDNGCGMTHQELANALQFGGTTRFSSRKGIGRFGMGLPNAAGNSGFLSLVHYRERLRIRLRFSRGSIFMAFCPRPFGSHFVYILLLFATAWSFVPSLHGQTAANSDAVCRPCHQEIYDKYQQTPMAHASGDAVDGLISGSFFHQTSEIDYRLFLEDGKAWLSYDRTASKEAEALHGQERLVYFIGSGNRGRTYLFQRQGFWFESPVNWYGKKQLWDMNPKSLEAKEMPFTLPVDSTCLHCHTTGAAVSLPGSRNHFAGAPFRHGGIGCASCHGEASQHLAQQGQEPMLKLSSLTGSRKDSICLQCHLEGETAVNQPGKSLVDFHPGGDLSSDVRFFAHAGEIGSEGRATSQWEALLESACYRKSSGRMTCTTCHDPHSSPPPEQRAAFFRAKCLACHNTPQFISHHHPDHPDCSSCHMARLKSEDIAHEQVTDHFIQKRPATNLPPAILSGQDLLPIGSQSTSERDLGLAYAQAVIKGDPQEIEKARDLLHRAEKQEEAAGTSAADVDLHTNLGFMNLLSNDTSGATREYEAALTTDPHDSSAAADLAVIKARAHQVAEALSLWRIVAEDDPGHTAAGYNLAAGDCMLGNAPASIEALDRVIAFSPDDTKARKFLVELQTVPGVCSNSARHQQK